MTYSPVLIIHIGAGMIAVLSGFGALLVRKGSPLHRKTGFVFAVSMLLMAIGGAYLGLLKSQRMNIIAGLFTFYLVATAWLTVRRKERQTGSLEAGLLLIGVLVGGSALLFGWDAAHSTSRDTEITEYVLGSAALLSSLGDIRVIVRGGVAGVPRLVRHLWRMCFALFIATGSFFLGTADDPTMGRIGLRSRLFTPAIRATHLPQLPVLIVVVLMVFWLFWVRISKRYRKVAA